METFGTTKKNHAMENHTIEIHVREGIAVVSKSLSEQVCSVMYL